jgi:beta-N-acetylhexosaminidase
MLFCGCSPDELAQANSDNSKAEETLKNINAIREDSGVPPLPKEKDENSVVAAAAVTDPVEEILSQMTLEEKVGQMVMIGFHGTTANDDVNWMLNQYYMGGIILFDRNMENKAQVKTLTESLQKDRKIPLFFAVDEEGGQVARMAHDLTPPMSQKDIGFSGDFTLAYTSAKDISQELKNMGFNVNFAPVADVGTPDTRSFSNNGDVVGEFVSQAAKGYEDAGLFYCLKHFPGIGLWHIDSHKDIETITGDRNTFDTVDLVPFKKIISENDNSKFMVMVSHYKYTAFDAENSATLSSAVMTDLLRNELGFKGVIITDDLDMGAVSKYHDEKSLSVASVKAGADIILSCHDYEKQRIMYEGILNAVKSGEISEDRINDSVRRILTMKLPLMK